MEYVLNFFQPGVLFNPRPERISAGGLQIMLAIFLILLIAATVLNFYMTARIRDKLLLRGLKKIRFMLFTMSILGFIYAWFAYEGAIFLSMRAIFLLWVIGFVVWAVFPVKFLLKDRPRIIKAWQEKKKYEKYMP